MGKRDTETRIIGLAEAAASRLSLSSALSALCLLTLLCCLSFVVTAGPAQAAAAESSPVIKTVAIVKEFGAVHAMDERNVLAQFRTEVVSDKESRSRGLAGRDSLPVGSAMLFVLPKDELPYFWMKDMRFPIDILFFSSDQRFIGAVENLKPCEQCEIIAAPQRTAFALEVNAGLTRKIGIVKGDRFVYKEK